MRILFVVEHFPSVSETFVLNQVTGLLDRGHDVEICALGRPDGEQVHPDVEVYGLMERSWDRISIPPNWINRFGKAISQIRKCIKSGRLGIWGTLNVFRYEKDSLDIGSSYGWFVSQMNKLGYDAVGVENDPIAKNVGFLAYGLSSKKCSFGLCPILERAWENTT